MEEKNKYIPTITAVFNKPIAYKPILSSLPPADWCNHSVQKNLCAFCSKLPFTTKSEAQDCSGSNHSVSTLPATYDVICGRHSAYSVLYQPSHHPSVPDGSISDSLHTQVAQMKLSDPPELHKKVCECRR